MKRQTTLSALFSSTRSLALLSAIAGLALSGTACDDSSSTTTTDASADTGGGDGAGVTLTMDKPTYDFGNVVITKSSAPITVTVTNTGTGASLPLTSSASGGDSAAFIKGTDTCTGVRLAAKATCSITFTFSPASTGTKSSGFGVLSGTAGSPNAAPAGATFTGVGVAPAAFAATPIQQTAGSVEIGKSSTVIVTVTNTGGVASGVPQIVVGGNNPTLFVVNQAASTCTAVLAPMASCTLSIVFTPDVIGGFSSIITISGADTASGTANLLGTGIPVGTISIDPPTRNFGSIQVGSPSTASVFTITNNGPAATENLLVTLGGDSAGDYARTTTCVAALASKATCTVSVIFTPTAAGSRQAELVVTATNNRLVAGLSGTGVRPASLRLTPAAQLFGSTAVGSSGTPVTFTVTNTGGVDSSALSFTKAGAAAADFTVSQNNCAGVLAGGASCTLQIVFSPTALGARDATYAVTATTGGTSEATLNGTGIGPGSIQVSPSAWNIAPVALSGMVDQVFTVTNPGQVPTSTVSVSLGGANSADFTKLADSCNGTVISPGVPCSITLRFKPGTVGARTGTLTVGAATGGTVPVPLSGSGLADALLASTPPQQDFGGIVVGLDSSPVVFTIRNNGQVSTGTLVATAIAGPNGQSNNFLVTDNCGGQVLDSGGQDTCQISVFFRPVSEGSKTSTITVGDGPNKVDINVFGSGLPPASLVVTPTPYSFGEIVIGESSEAATFTIQNVGGSATGNLAIAPFGADASQWTIDRAGCPAQGIASGQSCSFTAIFTPVSPAGNKATVLRVSANEVVFDVSVTGQARRKTVIGNNGDAAFATLVNSASHAHGDAPSAMRLIDDSTNGANPYRRNFHITCNRSTACGPFTFSLGGTNAADFEISAAESGDCGAGVLASGATCRKAVQIRPRDLSMAGPQSIAKSAVLNVDSADNEEDLLVNLTGNSINPIYMYWIDQANSNAVTQANYGYGDIINGTWGTKAFTNRYNEFMPASRPYSYFMTGADQGPFSVVDGGCVGNDVAQTAANSDTCTSFMRFIPSRVGNHSATLNTRLQVVGTYPASTTLTFNFTDSIGVTGNGTPAPDLQLVSAPQSVTTVSGTDSALVTVVFQNAGGTITSGIVSANTSPSNVAITNLGGTCNTPANNALTPGETCTVTFNIDSTPPTGVVVDGNVRVSLQHNLAANPGSVSDYVDVDIPVTITPQITVTAAGGAFGSYAGGLSDTRTYTIRNISGSSTLGTVSASLVDNCGNETGFAAIAPNTCVSALAPNGTCDVTVQFTAPSQATGSDHCISLLVVQAQANISLNTEITATGLGNGDLSFFPANTAVTRYFGSTALGANSEMQVVRIRNLGAFNTGTLVPVIGGSGAAQFLIDTFTATPGGENRCGTAGFLNLDPNVSCVYILRYFPSAGGTPFDDVATFRVTGAFAGTDTGTIGLEGENVVATGVTVSPTFVDLLVATAGANGNSQTFTITNGTGGTIALNSGGALSIVDATGSGVNTQFAITSTNCPANLVNNAFCSATVRYEPDALVASGTRHVARLFISGTATDGTWASLEGRVQSPALVSMSPSGNLDFEDLGTATVGVAKNVVFTLTNTGDVAATVSSISLAGPNSSEYSIQSNGCSSVPALGSCQFTVRLLATSGNFKEITLTVNTSGGNFTSDLQIISLVPSSLALSPDNGTLGGVTPVTGTNPNLQYILVENSIFGGESEPLQFSLNDNENWRIVTDYRGGPLYSCGSLRNEAGEIRLGGGFFFFGGYFSCYVGIEHMPRASGVQANTPQQVTLTVTAGALTQTETVNATAKTAVDVTPASASFCADVNVGTDSRDFTFALDNGNVSNDAADTMTERMQTRITGGDADDFGIIFDNCAGEILDSDSFGESQNQTSCNIRVAFRPQTAGPASANLEVSIITQDGISISRSAALTGATANCAN
jgi:hypothetical protein